mgnify:CR=1 FL=1
MRHLASYQKFLGAAVAVLTVALTLIPNAQVEAQANEAAIESAIEAEYQIDSAASVKLTISLTNISSDKVLTSYELPNVWSIVQPRITNAVAELTSFSNTSESLKFDFSQRPVDPGRMITIQLQGQSAAFTSLSGVRIFKQRALNPFPAGENLRLHKLTVNFPANWPAYHLNLTDPEASLQETEAGKPKQLQFEPKFLPVEIIWVEKHNLAVSYEYNLGEGSQQLASLPRRSALQVPQYSAQTGVSRVFRDDMGNNYVAIDPQQAGSAKLKHEYSVGINPDSQLLRKTELSIASRSSFPLPAQLAAWRKSLEGQDVAQKIELTAQKLATDFQIKTAEQSGWKISESGLTSGQTQLDYLEYLLLLNEILTSSGVKNTVVYLDNRYLGQATAFVIEVCEQVCKYYDPAAQMSQRSNRQLPPAGLQLLAFDGIDQLAFTMLARKGALLPANVQIWPFASAQQDVEKGVLIVLSIPAEVKNFDNFTTQVMVDNQGQTPIFLEELKIAGASFPIVDSSLAGLYEGVLPGQKREYRVDNVFLPLLFFGGSIKTEIEIGLVYQDDEGFEIYSRSQPIVVSQNGGFWAGVILSLSTFVLTLTVLYMIYKRNKYVIKGGYWKLRRRLNELLWSINPINRIRNIT